MTEEDMDWDKYVKVFNLPINNIKVRKEVSKADVLMSLMSEGDIAFKFRNNQMVMKIDKVDDIKTLEDIIWKSVREYVRLLKEEKLKKELKK